MSVNRKKVRCIFLNIDIHQINSSTQFFTCSSPKINNCRPRPTIDFLWCWMPRPVVMKCTKLVMDTTICFYSYIHEIFPGKLQYAATTTIYAKLTRYNNTRLILWHYLVKRGCKSDDVAVARCTSLLLFLFYVYYQPK